MERASPRRPEVPGGRHQIADPAKLRLDGIQAFTELALRRIEEEDLGLGQRRGERVVDVVAGAGDLREHAVQLQEGLRSLLGALGVEGNGAEVARGAGRDRADGGRVSAIHDGEHPLGAPKRVGGAEQLRRRNPRRVNENDARRPGADGLEPEGWLHHLRAPGERRETCLPQGARWDDDVDGLRCHDASNSGDRGKPLAPISDALQFVAMPEHPRDTPAGPPRRAATLARHLLGVGLLALVYVPLYDLLSPETTGLAGASTRRIAGSAWGLGLWGTVSVLGIAVVLALVVRVDLLAPIRRVGHALEARRSLSFALTCGALTLAVSAMVAGGLYGGRPTSVDEMVQLLHARALLAGRPSLPLPADPAAWVVQNSIVRDGAWVSVYPPMHTLLLAAGLGVGAWWLVGPLATALLVAATALALDRLLPGRRGLARGASLLLALSPFLVFLGGTGLSHASAGAFAALTLLAALRARDGSWFWSVGAGAAVGALVCARPWTGIALGTALVAATWLAARQRRADRLGWSLPRIGGLLLGGLPFAVLLFLWNARLFGEPLRLGYLAAYGPSHGLGFHPDPWGNAYGAREALAYTSADLTQLGVTLFESPLPALALVGLGLALLRTLPRGSTVLIVWAMAGVAANAVYWHHGIHFGPRLLFETAPAWVALWVLCVAGLTAPESPLPPVARRAVAWAAALSLAGGILLVPGVAESYAPTPTATAVSRLPQAPGGPALFFVHGSWSSRVVARLVSAGMRRDSVETALRRNALCSVDRYARWRAGEGGDPPPLDLRPASGTPARLSWATISPGNRALVDPAERTDGLCSREAASDRFGTVELEPLLWQAPPLSGSATVVARDLGPAVNAAVREAFPGYRAWAVLAGPEGEASRLLPYDEAMTQLWEGAPTTARR